MVLHFPRLLLSSLLHNVQSGCELKLEDFIRIDFIIDLGIF